MSQHDFEIANQGFPAFRSDLNDGLQALASNSAGATAPSTTYAYQFWYDSTANLLKMRNADDDAWITLAYFDQTNDEWEVRSAVIQAVDSAGVTIKADNGESFIACADDGAVTLYYDNSAKLATTNTGVDVTGTVTADGADLDGAVVINESGADVDFRVESDTDANALFVEGSTSRVGIGTDDPAYKLEVVGSYEGSEFSALRLWNDTTNTEGTYTALEMPVFNGSAGFTIRSYGNSIDSYHTFITTRQSNGYLKFGTSQASERMRIDSNGNLLVGKTTTSIAVAGAQMDNSGSIRATRDSAEPMFVNRLTNDGNLVNFYQDTSFEGSISISGSTVSYNGGHLSRWSRLADDSKDTSIVKGTVMTNLDAMVEWSHEAVEEMLDEEGNVVTEAKEAYTEDNEQLNKMAVSSVEGDPNVAGVFVNWDDDDDFNDMNIAMTGDMVIRIAQGTTVERGDLLMSAGDGTAKPQGDDIVRSKTIAKVTSTHVSHTYDDGSYLVPCVLMAC